MLTVRPSSLARAATLLLLFSLACGDDDSTLDDAGTEPVDAAGLDAAPLTDAATPLDAGETDASMPMDAETPIDGGPCVDVVCDTPPADRCESSVAVTYAAAGTCADGTCDYAESTTDCAATDRFCMDGACLDPCTDVVCDTPPAASCTDSVLTTYPATGTCSSPGGVPQCDYAGSTADCAASDQACSGGACVDPCVGVTCDTPPAASCTDSVLTTYAAAGTCSSPGGVPQCDYAASPTDCATSDQACSGGACVDPCVGVTCDTPPAASCTDSVLTTYPATGTCSSPGGVPQCDYAASPTDCATSDQACSGGACVDPCVGVTCDTPPADFCTDAVLTTYPATGTCSSPGGVSQCDYAASPTDCAASDQACSGGACVAPCSTAPCTAVPAASCAGSVLTTYAPRCTETGGATYTCDYDASSFDCSDIGGTCSGGACVVAGENCRNGIDDDGDTDVDCADADCAASPYCLFGYNFDFASWGQVDPPYPFDVSSGSTSTSVLPGTDTAGDPNAAVTWRTTGTVQLDYLWSTAAPTTDTVTFHAWVDDTDPAGRARLMLVHNGTNFFSGAYSTDVGWQELTYGIGVTAGDTLMPAMRFYDVPADWDGDATVAIDDWALTTPVSWTLDDSADTAAYGILSNAASGQAVYAAVNDAGELYAGHTPDSGGDSFLFVWAGAPDPSATVPAMWAKAGVVAGPDPAGRLLVLAHEGSSGYCEWRAWDTTMGVWQVVVPATCNGGPWVEGVVPLATVFPAYPTTRELAFASAHYGTNDGDALDPATQLPASGDTDGDVDADEALVLRRAAILAGRVADYVTPTP